MNYLIAVLADRMQAEAASVVLEKEGFGSDRVDILGRGYKNADEFGFPDPDAIARDRALKMMFWLVPFGFAAGLGFSLQTGLHTFAWAGEIGNHLVGGLLGAIGGAMGAIFNGGGVGLIFGSGDALPYRNRLAAGKYLVAVRGSKEVLRQAAPLLKQFDPETLQTYTKPEA